jgi:hypothetical protein
MPNSDMHSFREISIATAYIYNIIDSLLTFIGMKTGKYNILTSNIHPNVHDDIVVLYCCVAGRRWLRVMDMNWRISVSCVYARLSFGTDGHNAVVLASY